MKRGAVSIDAGPLVAIVSRRDAHHQQCVAELATLPAPLLTCWPVLAEALWLVRKDPAAVAGLFRGFADDLWTLAPISVEALPWLEAFLTPLLGTWFLYPEGVASQSPGSRSAPWEKVASPGFVPRRGWITPTVWVIQPLRGRRRTGRFFPQGALRDPGLWDATPSG